MDKVAQTPESDLQQYFDVGQQAKFKRLTKTQIRRLYFNWLKDSTDTRSFDEVFQDKYDSHEKQWLKQYNIKKVDFVPTTLGTVTLSYTDNTAKLTFKSARHRPLVITKPIKSHFKLLKRVKEKVNNYNEENVVTIDLELLKSNLNAPIITTLLLF